MSSQPAPTPAGSIAFYNRYLLLIAGLGGLLYGIDVGIIAGALPYLEATAKYLDASALSVIVAAVLLGSVISTLFAGFLSDVMGRKAMMIVSGALFVASIPIIALSDGFLPLVLGRLLQGISAGFIGVVVPLYLAECLSADNRGKGTGVFQWLLTLGIFAAAVIGYGFSVWLGGIAEHGTAEELFSAKDHAWRWIFWVSILPGILFTVGAFFVTESPRWLFKRRRVDAALAALCRSRGAEQAKDEMREMEEASHAQAATTGQKIKDSILSRKYVIPFILACVILACNQATGINSIIAYNATILIQAGLNDAQAHLGYVILTLVNFLMTIVAVTLVDKKGRKFLLSVGSGGIIVSLVIVGLIFRQTEKTAVDCKEAVQAMVASVNKEKVLEDGSKQSVKDEAATIDFDEAKAAALLIAAGKPEAAKDLAANPATLFVIYSCGDFPSATRVVRSDEKHADQRTVEISKNASLPADSFSGKVAAFFKNPFANLDASRKAPLVIESALITPAPSAGNGWLVAVGLFVAVAFFAIGPGVCVWLALSELMPTRIRSNGMSVALLINQSVSTTIAATFLPFVGKFGYSTIFYAFAGFTVIYFITAAFFLPETKGRTLEEIEEHFEGKKKLS